MESLPEGAAGELVRALGVYLRAKKVTDLPARLRPYKNFHSKALLTRRTELLEVFDEDEGLRARIVEWLNDKPNLPTGQAELLRVASERSEGWRDRLTYSFTPTHRRAKTRPAVDHSAAAGKERERAQKARTETKRVREEAQATIRELRAELAAARGETRKELTAFRAANKKLEGAEKVAAKARADLERERRKMKTETDKLTKAAAAAKRELRDARRQLQQREREVARLEEKVAALSTARKTPARSRPSGRRKPLPVPPGRLEDAPETLDTWLAAPGVHLLVDGYNATLAEGGFANLDLADQRQRLIEEVARLARRKGFKVTIVFDGSDVVAAKRSRSPVRVQYSKPDEIADDHLIGLLEGMPPDPVVLATGDRELQGRGRRLGATIATSEQLLALIR
jgi:predicted RNA-binding protein with PIN domain